MFPIRDNIPSRTFPFVNYTVIGLCSLAFFAQLSQQSKGVSLVERLGMIPARISNPDQPIVIPETRIVRTPFGLIQEEVQRELAPSFVPPILTALTCIFLHGGWMHFLGNMWFLYIFGDNVEDRMGHGGYLLFYMASGVAASVAHFATGPTSPIPTIGASGAIAGVMGAYMFLYPKALVLTVIPIFIIIEMLVIPAPIFLGVWFVMQFFQGVASITSMQSTGVAWWAHIGGFAAGAFVALILNQLHWLRPGVEDTRKNAQNVRVYQVYPRRRF